MPHRARCYAQIPAHGLRLVVVRPADLDADGRGRLRRNEEADLAPLRNIVARDSDEDRVTDPFRIWLLADVRQLLHIDVYEVTDDDRVYR